jgi:hypothetical protein
MLSYFDAQHWARVRDARAALGLNRIPRETLLRPNHQLAHATLRHRASGEIWTVTAVREDWLVGRYLAAALERNGRTRVCVVEILSSDRPEIHKQFDAFSTEFEVLAP